MPLLKLRYYGFFSQSRQGQSTVAHRFNGGIRKEKNAKSHQGRQIRCVLRKLFCIDSESIFCRPQGTFQLIALDKPTVKNGGLLSIVPRMINSQR
ncbi:MAG: hypothetical protein JWM11_2658 [Planctomycetaceae bacterium]|nr:hypothetical protein [Planctomycetaceae bacterium]